MSLVQMSVSGAVMIVFTVIIRALLLYKLPKRIFPFLWCLILARLLIPFSLPCEYSAYSFLTRQSTPKEMPENITVPPFTDFLTESAADVPSAPLNAPAEAPSVDIRLAVWLAGALICFVFFAVSYVGCRMKFRESLPADSEYIRQWLAEHKIFRRISVRCSDRISSPLTYGVFRPVILLPKNYAQFETDDLKFVLTHEYVHIQRFDAVFKLVLTAAACIHWFNPLVWVMLVIANRDIEISCDEAVVRMSGECEKRAYAMTLIRLEEVKSGLTPLNNFSKNAVKERIVTIMKFQKATALTVIASICLVAGTTTVFATSAISQDNGDVSGQTTSVSDNSKPDDFLTSNPDENVPLESLPEPVEEKPVSVEEWLKQPHSAPLANVSEGFDPAGEYVFIPAQPEAEVYAADDGKVVWADTAYSNGLGATVVVRHSESVYTFYSHLNYDTGFAVEVGDNVKAGQCVGYVGISGAADCYGLGLFCRDHMLDFEWKPVYDEENAPKEEPDDYDYMIPVDGIGFICGYDKEQNKKDELLIIGSKTPCGGSCASWVCDDGSRYYFPLTNDYYNYGLGSYIDENGNAVSRWVHIEDDELPARNYTHEKIVDGGLIVW